MLEYKKQDKPKSIEMCLSADTVSKNLWNAADGLEKAGKLIMYIMIAIGLIAAIGDFASLSDLDEMTAFISAVSVFFQWGLYAMIAVTAFWGISLLVRGLAKIVYNTDVTARLAWYNTQDSNQPAKTQVASAAAVLNTPSKPVSAPQKAPVSHSWRCPQCAFPISNYPCNECGYTPGKVPYLCGNCGHPGPYEGSCPKCSSSIKLYKH